MCDDCFGRLNIESVYLCPACSRPSDSGRVCAGCAANSHLDGVGAYFRYSENNAVSALIKYLKYKYIRDIEHLWRKIVDKAEMKFGFNLENLLIIPVPLHYLRQRERGFNQAEILTNIISQKFALKMDSANLRRQRHTVQQAKLSGSQRRENLTDAFVWKGETPAAENILLVDDVYTTGATMQECAKTLKKCGAKMVWGLVLARE